MKKIACACGAVVFSVCALAQTLGAKKEIRLLPDEHWYGAETVLGDFEPFSATNCTGSS